VECKIVHKFGPHTFGVIACFGLKVGCTFGCFKIKLNILESSVEGRNDSGKYLIKQEKQKIVAVF
jgi:hypothetical protein